MIQTEKKNQNDCHFQNEGHTDIKLCQNMVYSVHYQNRDFFSYKELER